MSCGFTATMMSPAPRIASVFDRSALTPYFSRSSARWSSRRPVTASSSGDRHPELRNPRSIDSPSRPAPRIAIRVLIGAL